MASASCANCQKTAEQVPNMKQCAKCKSTPYCSRDCQKAHWKTHKKVCSSNPASNPESGGTSSATPNSQAPRRIKNLEKQIQSPFTRLDSNTYLHERSEKDVYKLLVDSFRMRQADAFKFQGLSDPDSIYTGATSSISGFRTFLSLASRRDNVLPPWWNDDKAKECEQFGESGDTFSSLKKRTDKDAVIAHYGEQTMPMQVRMLAEEIYGSPPAGGPPGTTMRRAMMRTEAGGSDGQGFATMLSL